jgi:hypothetical protein
MASRGSRTRDLKVAAIISLAFFIILAIVGLVETSSKALNVPAQFIVFGSIAVVVGCLFALLIYRSIRYERVRQALFAKVDDVTQYHLQTLSRRRAQLVQIDPYGQPKFEKWQKELGQFISTHIEPFLSKIERAALQKDFISVWRHVEGSVLEESSRSPAFHAFSESIDTL